MAAYYLVYKKKKYPAGEACSKGAPFVDEVIGKV